MRTETI